MVCGKSFVTGETKCHINNINLKDLKKREILPEEVKQINNSRGFKKKEAVLFHCAVCKQICKFLNIKH